MPHVDLSLDELRVYRPTLPEPDGLHAFWSETLQEAAASDLDATFVPHESRLRTVDVFDVSFRGFAGQRVSGWLVLPRDRSGPLPCVVQYIGYGGGRGLPHERLDWSAFGFAHLVMDSRGQGSDGAQGATPDSDPDGSPPHVPGFLTLGLPDPRRHYYRRMFTDAVRAVEAARSHPDVDADTVVVSGHSQGGGLALAAGALRGWVLDDPPAAVLADAPFLCHIRRGAEMAADGPYLEVARWCGTHRDRAEDALVALAHVDAAVLGGHARSPALVSVSLRDEICPPSTVFAAVNGYAAPVDLRVYEWNEHDAGGAHHRLDQVRWLDEVLAR